MEVSLCHGREYHLKMIFRTCVLLAAARWSLHGQPKAFDVASLKIVSPLRGGEDGFVSFGETKGRISFRNITPKLLICKAYAWDDKNLMGLPDWADTTYYDLSATFAAEASAEEVRRMLQKLLEESFRLRLHQEEKATRGFALVVDAKGAKLAASSSADKPHAQFNLKSGELYVRHGSIAVLAGVLSRAMGQPVEDLTHLDGEYDFELKWAPESAGGPDAAPSDRPSIVAALAEQLGLKLRKQTVSVKRLHVDAIARPPNDG